MLDKCHLHVVKSGLKIISLKLRKRGRSFKTKIEGKYFYDQEKVSFYSKRPKMINNICFNYSFPLNTKKWNQVYFQSFYKRTKQKLNNVDSFYYLSLSGYLVFPKAFSDIFWFAERA